MSDIPSELFREILLRLPAESLVRFRSVCKTWLRIIDDPSFVKAHTNNQIYSHTLFVRNETGAPLFSFSLDSLNFINGPQNIEATRIKQLIRLGVPRLPDLSQVASCNGIVLLCHENVKKIWAIWNPLTGECRELPRPNASLKLVGYGFGYDYDADDYKVVRIDSLVSKEKKIVFQTLVYSLKSGSWSMIEGCPRYYMQLNPGAFLNGTLYWSADDSVIALDLRTESYSQLPLPAGVVNSEFSSMGDVDALDGCLILTRFFQYQFDGWVVKDNGVEKSWAKLFSLSCSLFRDAWRLKLVAYLKSKRQVVLQHNLCFLWFDLDKNSVLKFSVHGFPHIESSQICPGSLVRLNARGSSSGFGAVTASKTTTGKRKRETKKTDTRLKICVRDVEEAYCSDYCFVSGNTRGHCFESDEESYCSRA